jgi:endonuclease YncB( thermonuclease family)
LLFLLAVAWPALAGTVTVDRALDGDSVRLADGRQLRLIGINAPEFGKDGAAPQPLAREARAALAAMVDGRALRAESGREPHDRHGRVLAHLYTDDDRSVEDELLRRGLAWLVAVPPNTDRVHRLAAAEAEARADRRGVWAEPAYAPQPVESLAPTDTGFRFVTATVRAVDDRRHAYYVQLAPRAWMIIPRQDWREYFSGRAGHGRHPNSLVGRRVEVRGWFTARGEELRVRIGHPAMLAFQ